MSKLKEEAVTTNRALSDVALSHMLEAKRKERLRSAQLGHLQGELNNARKKLQLIEGKFDTPEGRAEQVLVNEREWHDA